jgi:predicted phage terminase large subunit-like protein
MPGALHFALGNPEVVSTLLAERSLAHFIRQLWRYIDPAPYVHNWHIDAICLHLEAVSCGAIRRLLITMPPRHMKSISVSVAWPAWTWITYPQKQFLFSSYAEALSVRDSVKCRRLIQSPLYQQRWAGAFDFWGDQNAKQRYDNSSGGYRIATSVDGMLTGEGGDVIVVDDPHNVRQVESPVKRQAVIDWWKESMSTRLNSPETGARVVIMQRSHEEDLAGHILESESGWVHLNLPARYEVEQHCTTPIGWEDPRGQEGELLYPQRFSHEAIGELEGILGAYGTAAQLQQRPSPRGGGLFEVDKFVILKEAPAPINFVRTLRYWDKAGTQDGGKRTAGVKMAKLKNGTQIILDVVKGQWGAGARERRIRQVAETDGQEVRVWVEQEPGSGGKESAQSSVRSLAGFVARADRVTGDKEVRAEPYASSIAAGNVLLLLGEWTEDFIKEHELAPRGKFQDQWDAAAGAFNKLNVGRVAGIWGRG